jgi:hypothetical protein
MPTAALLLLLLLLQALAHAPHAQACPQALPDAVYFWGQNPICQVP